jgi:hypothetical protein
VTYLGTGSKAFIFFLFLALFFSFSLAQRRSLKLPNKKNKNFYSAARWFGLPSLLSSVSHQ